MLAINYCIFSLSKLAAKRVNMRLKILCIPAVVAFEADTRIFVLGCGATSMTILIMNSISGKFVLFSCVKRSSINSNGMYACSKVTDMSGKTLCAAVSLSFVLRILPSMVQSILVWSWSPSIM